MHALPLFIFTLLLLHASTQATADTQAVRLGVLKFGTVNWELDVIKHHGLDRKYGIDLQITPLGGKSATHVALQGDSVDVIVSDWIWVSRQRSEGRLYSFAPYSNAVGALMVNADLNTRSLNDLKGRKIGVAGGPVDKTWLLLRAYSRRILGQDLAEFIEPSFAAPPLLNKLVIRGDLDGAINFWHYTARLKAAGLEPLLDMPEILSGLGIDRGIPLIGWVFDEPWARTNPRAINGLLQASRDAKDILLESDEEWRRLRPLMKADDQQVFLALRKGFRAGIPRCFGSSEIDAARRTFDILARLGGEKLTGRARRMDEKTFWSGFKWQDCEGV